MVQFNPIEFLIFLDDKNERVLVLKHLHFTHIDDILEVKSAGEMKMGEKPEELVFLA